MAVCIAVVNNGLDSSWSLYWATIANAHQVLEEYNSLPT